MNTCGSCRYFLQINGDEFGKCRRCPPAVYWDVERNIVSEAYPDLFPDDWCGEFQPDMKAAKALPLCAKHGQVLCEPCGVFDK